MRDEVFALVFGFAAGCLFAGILFSAATERDYRERAIEAGVAEWRIDAKTGETEFHWIGKDER